jgi:predicted regulator of Ras-like GTPase activity (Roadblock/LC7/MglB family)
MIVPHEPSPTRLVKLLREMISEGNFSMAVLADRDGLLIAAVTDDEQSSEAQSVAAALLQRAFVQVQSQLGMAETDEFSLFDVNGTRWVCRPFQVGEQTMILAVIVPNRNHPYRRLTTRTIHAIQQLWQA